MTKTLEELEREYDSEVQRQIEHYQNPKPSITLKKRFEIYRLGLASIGPSPMPDLDKRLRAIIARDNESLVYRADLNDAQKEAIRRGVVNTLRRKELEQLAVEAESDTRDSGNVLLKLKVNQALYSRYRLQYATETLLTHKAP